MLKKDIKYTTFDGDEVTETFYFHLAKNEVIQMNARFEGGLQGLVRRIGLTKDMRLVLEEMEKIVLLTVGKKSEDGRHFMKSDAIRDEFKGSPAYDELFMDLLTKENAAADFIIGALPSDIGQQAKQQAGLPQPNIQPVEKPVTTTPPPPAPPTSDKGIHI